MLTDPFPQPPFRTQSRPRSRSRSRPPSSSSSSSLLEQKGKGGEGSGDQTGNTDVQTPLFPLEMYDLASLQAQVHSLETIQHQLSSKIKDLREQRPFPPGSRNQAGGDSDGKGSAMVPPMDDDILSQTFSSNKASRELQLENVYRMAGITSFTVKDPNPVFSRNQGRAGEKEGGMQDEEEKGKLIGIRIESFSKAKFLPPYYLLLTVNTVQVKDFAPSTKSLSVTYHTIPQHINLPSLISKYLPHRATLAEQNLEKLVRELRRRICLFQRREDMVRDLKQEYLGSDKDKKKERSRESSPSDEEEEEEYREGEGTSVRKLGKPTSISTDAAYQLLEITWLRASKRVAAHLILSEEGDVKNVVVKEYRERGGGRESVLDRRERRGRYRVVERLFREKGVVESIRKVARGRP